MGLWPGAHICHVNPDGHVGPSKPLDTARVLDVQAGLALHEFPRSMVKPESVSDSQLIKMLGNCQHVRAAAAAWVVGTVLLTGGRGRTSNSTFSSNPFFMRVQCPCSTQPCHINIGHSDSCAGLRLLHTRLPQMVPMSGPGGKKKKKGTKGRKGKSKAEQKVRSEKAGKSKAEQKVRSEKAGKSKAEQKVKSEKAGKSKAEQKVKSEKAGAKRKRNGA